MSRVREDVMEISIYNNSTQQVEVKRARVETFKLKLEKDLSLCLTYIKSSPMKRKRMCKYIFFYSIGTNRHSIYALTIASLIVALALTKKENSALSTSRKPRFVSPGMLGRAQVHQRI